MQIELSRTECDDLSSSIAREWLVTNGLGGYASGTIAGVNTRRYHGLLMAAVRPPVDRVALLLRLNEALTIEGETFELMTAEYEDGTINPAGYRFLESFTLEQGIPVWSYAVGDFLLRRSVWMVPGRNITVVRYKLAVGSGLVDLALRPLCAARDHHSVQHGSIDWHFSVESIADGALVRATPQSPPLWLLARGASFSPGGDWYWRFLLREERDRGYDHIEDLYQPGTFHAFLRPGATLTFIASAEDPSEAAPDPDIAQAAIRGLHTRVYPGMETKSRSAATWLDDLRQTLSASADQFVVRRQPLPPAETPQVSVLAGYHWFTDWGRDAMICLPGLLLGTGRIAEAESLLRTFAGYIDQGMIPNRFPDFRETPEYNTVDATLWLFHALRATIEAGASASLLADIYPRLREVIDWHMRGTRFGIRVDPTDGLLFAGEISADGIPTQLTWMDARVSNRCFTPRIGKPVEINALWITALDCMAEWASAHNDSPSAYRAAADKAASSFLARFWFQEGGYLYDVVDGPDGDDSRLRPNQLIALACRRQLVAKDQGLRALERIEAELITPYGLRTLSADHPEYVGECRGDQPTRDLAYHQGTVWTWLLGPYVDACRQFDKAETDFAELIREFHPHLREAGVGCISEIFDGDAPHMPRGCIQQGWSVAELSRIANSLD